MHTSILICDGLTYGLTYGLSLVAYLIGLQSLCSHVSHLMSRLLVLDIHYYSTLPCSMSKIVINKEITCITNIIKDWSD